MLRWLTTLLLFASLSLTLSAQERVRPENERMRLEIGYYLSTPLNREIADRFCLNFEAINPSYFCEHELIGQSRGEELEEERRYDLILTSEQNFYQNLEREHRLILPIYEEVYVALGRRGESEQIFSDEERIGIVDDVATLEKIRALLKRLNIKEEQLDITLATPSNLVDQFCNFDLDVVLHLSTHPDPFVRNLNTACDAKLLPLSSSVPRQFFQRNRYLYEATIPQNYYWRLDDSVNGVSERYFVALREGYHEQIFGLVLANFFADLSAHRLTWMSPEKMKLYFTRSENQLDSLALPHFDRYFRASANEEERQESNQEETL